MTTWVKSLNFGIKMCMIDSQKVFQYKTCKYYFQIIKLFRIIKELPYVWKYTTKKKKEIILIITRKLSLGW